jgi:hypothetical protein
MVFIQARSLQRFRQRGLHAAKVGPTDAGTGNQENVPACLDIRKLQPKSFTQPPLGAIAFDGVTDLLACNKRRPGGGGGLGARGGGEYQRPHAPGPARAAHPLDLGPARQAMGAPKAEVGAI